VVGGFCSGGVDCAWVVTIGRLGRGVGAELVPGTCKAVDFRRSLSPCQVSEKAHYGPVCQTPLINR